MCTILVHPNSNPKGAEMLDLAKAVVTNVECFICNEIGQHRIHPTHKLYSLSTCESEDSTDGIAPLSMF